MGDSNAAARLKELEAENRTLRAQLSKMMLSRSWRWTAPLRGLRGLIAVPDGPSAANQPGTPEPDLVAFVRASDRFDEDFYPGAEEARASRIDPIRHYLEVGEANGLQPSTDFNPDYYGERYPDVAAAGGNRFLHYLQSGGQEGRRALPVDAFVTFPREQLTGRDVVVVMVHDASRTGAPILAWNLVRKLKERHDVIVLLRRGGELVDALENAATVVVRWPEGVLEHPVDVARLVGRLVASYNPSYAIANSAETRVYVRHFEEAGVPVVALLHEFAEYMRPKGTLDELYAAASAIVFAAEIVSLSSHQEYPALAERDVHILPQGPTQVPRFPKKLRDQRRPTLLKGSRLLVAGIGAVHFRKGTDLFITIAARVREIVGQEASFLWVGPGYDPEDDISYSVYLRDQVMRFELGNALELFPAVDDVEPIYARADLFLLPSRLDPLPNVAIDAALRGIPVVCFDRASGFAEILGRDEGTRDLVVPYLDCPAAACAVSHMLMDPGLRRRRSKAIRALAEATFDMDRYVETIETIGLQLSAKRAEW